MGRAGSLEDRHAQYGLNELKTEEVMEITRTGRADPTTRRKGNRTVAAVRSMVWV